ncbi:hypothetical protein NBT05_07675 [Aquimarina sp. ERC-38]|uniref:hypothetical protein n=1 Tax=Aquimarina sp. ERC-38 TaxID=2949996 RepID=UPI0022462C19|nr:hypothetical protein [Aquimarina sp. ERC-38]UZO82344.1 hypothetical protein NBT05_07675 [Aquimarina sp. ERC-38]
MKLDDFKQQSLSSNELNNTHGGLMTGPLLHPDLRDAINEFGLKTAEAMWDGVTAAGRTVADTFNRIFG